MSDSLPRGWARAPLSSVFDSITDGDHLPPPQTAEGVPFLVIGNVRTGKIDFTDTRFVPTSYYDSLASERKPRRNDVLYTVTGSFGIPVLVDTNKPFCVQRHIAILRPADAISPSFFSRLLASPAVFAQAVGVATGTAQKTVPLKGLRGFVVPVPPEAEQPRIAEALDSYLSRLDDAQKTLEKVQRNLKRYRASVLKAAVEGRLVPTEAELARAEGRDYEPASRLMERILTERRRRWEEAELAKMTAAGKPPKDNQWKARYQEPLPVDATELPDLPEGWCWASMEHLIVQGPQNGLYVPRTQYGEGTPILRIDDYQFGWSRASNELQRVKIAPEDAARYGLGLGSLVINRVNSPSHLGKSVVVQDRHLPAVFESNMMTMALSSQLSPTYVHYYLSSVDGLKRLISDAKWAVNQASINQTDVARTVVPLPPAAEQVRISAEVTQQLELIEASSKLAAESSRRCARLRQSILKWAFEGKLADQDPTDEPASALLDRIRAERAAAEATKKPAPRGRSKKTATAAKST